MALQIMRLASTLLTICTPRLSELLTYYGKGYSLPKKLLVNSVAVNAAVDTAAAGNTTTTVVVDEILPPSAPLQNEQLLLETPGDWQSDSESSIYYDNNMGGDMGDDTMGDTPPTQHEHDSDYSHP